MKKAEKISGYMFMQKLERRMKYVELAASLGLILVLAAMVAPFFGGLAVDRSMGWRWVYAAGALIYTVARVIDVNAPGDSLRLKRLRRLEFWAGMCFIAGAAFWFYRLSYYSEIYSAGILAVMQQTVAFTMAGAVIQIVASWMISSRMKKEQSAGK